MLYKIGSKVTVMWVLVNENNDVIKQILNIDNKSYYHKIKNILNGSDIDEANKHIIEQQKINEKLQIYPLVLLF